MSTVTENDLKRLEDLITNFREEIKEQFKEVNSKIDKLDTKVDKLGEQVNALQVEVAQVKGELTGINKTLDSQEFTNRAIIVTIFGAMPTLLAKIFFPSLPAISLGIG